jgi:hypothetical protein
MDPIGSERRATSRSQRSCGSLRFGDKHDDRVWRSRQLGHPLRYLGSLARLAHNAHSNTDTHTNCYINADSYCDVHTNAHSDGYDYGYGYTYRDTNSNADSYCDVYTNAYSDGYDYTYRNANSNA